MDARHDQEEMEQAINQFLQLLEKQEKSFKDLATLVPVLTHSGPQVSNLGYPGLSQFIWLYPWLTPETKKVQVDSCRRWQ